MHNGLLKKGPSWRVQSDSKYACLAGLATTPLSLSLSLCVMRKIDVDSFQGFTRWLAQLGLGWPDWNYPSWVKQHWWIISLHWMLYVLFVRFLKSFLQYSVTCPKRKSFLLCAKIRMCGYLHCIAPDRKPKKKSSVTSTINIPSGSFVGHVTRSTVTFMNIVLRSGHFRSCLSSEPNYRQFTLSLCKVLV